MLYEFKINLEPSIINLYTKNGAFKDGMNQLKKVLIPALFKDLFQKVEEYSDRVIFLQNHQSVKMSESKEYINFKKSLDALTTGYFLVENKYVETGTISYSQEYLSETKNNAKNSIWDLIHKFPELNLAKEFRNTDFSEDLNKDVGHGRSYIITGRKIEQYVFKHPLSSKISAYYDTETEKIFIESDQLDKANASCVLLNKMMNGISKEHNLGKININPIFEEYEIDNSYNKVTFHFVYPNGISPEDSEEMFDKLKKYKVVSELDASQVDLTIKASESEKFSADEIESVGSEDGKYGYLKNITYNAKKIMKPMVKAYKGIKEVVIHEQEEDNR